MMPGRSEARTPALPLHVRLSTPKLARSTRAPLAPSFQRDGSKVSETSSFWATVFAQISNFKKKVKKNTKALKTKQKPPL
jgi:hypothetical protein